jgi:hypothetical protein
MRGIQNVRKFCSAPFLGYADANMATRTVDDFYQARMLATIWQEKCFYQGISTTKAPASSVDTIRKADFTNFDISACIFIRRLHRTTGP